MFKFLINILYFKQSFKPQNKIKKKAFLKRERVKIYIKLNNKKKDMNTIEYGP